MKTKLFLLVLLFVIPFGCKEEKNEIEIIPADEVYFAPDELDQPPRFISKDSKQANQEIVDLTFAINEFYQKLAEEEKKDFSVKYRFLFNKEGKAEKIQVIKSNYPQIDKQVAATIKEWGFEPPVKDGKKVKFFLPWSFDPKKLTGQIPLDLNTEKNIYFVAVEQMPEPIGGLYAIQSKIKYPEEAKRNGIEGRVFIQAFIDETGNVADAKVIKGVGSGLDEAALEAVKQTKFIPGKQEGKPVKVQVTIPIVFKLQ
jgi:TonB family protein